MKKFLILISMLFLSAASHAQSWTYNPAPMQAILSDVQYQGIMSSVTNSNSNATENPTQSAAASLAYIPSKARTRANLQAFATKTRVVDPAGADQMEKLFAATDIIGIIGEAMAKVGLDKNNAADAFAVYWVNAWQAANGRTDLLSAETFKAVAAQAARGLLQSAELAGANDAQKQEMAEALMLQAALIESSMEVAGSDRIQQQAVANAVLTGAAASGLNLDIMTLAEDGFVKRSAR